MTPVSSDVAPPGAGAAPILTIDRLSKRYRALWALRDASFSVRAGEILGLIGPNGPGKTTLFECLAGMIPATTGSVTTASGNHARLGAARRKQLLCYVPDRVRPWPDQMVGWALSFVAGLYGLDASQRDEVIEALGLDAFVAARLGELSKGEHKRVLVAIGLITPQPLLLLDEPFDGLDLRQTREVMSVLRIHAARGRTLFLSIHQLGDAARSCDRLILLSNGRIVGEGTVDELRTRAGVADGGLEEVFLALT